jgi:hypothetical protein
MAEPLILWDQTFRFLELLGRSPESVNALVFPPKTGPGSDKKATFKIKLDEAGRQEAERLLGTPVYRFHSFGIRPNPGGSKAEEITEGRALFFEADGGLSIEAQEALPELLGLPEPTVTVWTGGKSLHQYWAAPKGEGLSPEAWKQAQRRLIAAVASVSEEAGVDGCIRNPDRVMRAAGGLHPATGERCRIHSESGKLYSLAALVEMLPQPVASFGPSTSQKKWEEHTGELQNLADLGKATDALAYLPPEHFTGYMPWLGVGMALHSVTPALFDAWMVWSKGMGDAFDEEECRAKWETFSVERQDGLGLGSLIRLAKKYGYRPPLGKEGASRYPSSPPLPSSPSPKPAAGVRGLSIHERMDLLREKAEELLEESDVDPKN